MPVWRLVVDPVGGRGQQTIGVHAEMRFEPVDVCLGLKGSQLQESLEDLDHLILRHLGWDGGFFLFFIHYSYAAFFILFIYSVLVCSLGL